MYHFFQSENKHGNVVFNFRGGAINDLRAFAEGYHMAGMALVRKMASSPGYRDYEGYPILFLYRHALELYLKEIVYRGAKLLGLISDEQINTEKLFTSHELTVLLTPVEAIFEGVGWKWDFEISGLKSFEEFAALVQEIEKIDPHSYCFRYPVDRSGDASLPKHFVVYVVNFGRKIDPILELLDGAVMGLEHEWDIAAEAACYLQEMFKKQ
jgi:hypothetical protein